KPLSVNDAKTASSEISVYPNPAVDVLNIKAKSAVSQYEIYDFTGKKITNGKGEKVNVTNLPKGNYIIRINTENTSSVEKFIKK
ncbi:MAG: T9SS type A sorting domain-containing protein, partial [Bergeyella zoohelcum]|nr:T9SS type A sorting domain-containing protein [Bergeyella zoohelcum]